MNIGAKFMKIGVKFMNVGALFTTISVMFGNIGALLGNLGAMFGSFVALVVRFGSGLCGNETMAAWPGLRAEPGSRSAVGAKSYCVEQPADRASPEGWRAAASSTKATAMVKGLVSGRKYWFRVAAIGSAGQGAWSETVGMVAR